MNVVGRRAAGHVGRLRRRPAAAGLLQAAPVVALGVVAQRRVLRAAPRPVAAPVAAAPAAAPAPRAVAAAPAARPAPTSVAAAVISVSSAPVPVPVAVAAPRPIHGAQSGGWGSLVR